LRKRRRPLSRIILRVEGRRKRQRSPESHKMSAPAKRSPTTMSVIARAICAPALRLGYGLYRRLTKNEFSNCVGECKGSLERI